MRSMIIAFTLLASSAAWADPASVVCAACRSVYEYPKDYGNFAYNVLFSTKSTLTISEGQKVKVVNPRGEWGLVDLNFVLQFTGVTVSLGFISYNIQLPTGRIEIVVQDPNANLTEYFALSNSPPLNVGGVPSPSSTLPQEPEPTPEKPNSAGGGTELIDWGQEGPYYWYREMPGFSLHLAGSE